MLAPYFPRQRHIGHGSSRMTVIENGRQPVAGRFCESHVAGYHGPKHLISEILDELSRNIPRQAVARIIHGSQEALYVEVWIGPLAHAVDGLEKGGKDIQRVVLALHGYE